MILDIITSAKKAAWLTVLILPMLVSCSVLSGNTFSDNPAVNAQQQQIDILEDEVKAQERRTNEAEQLYKREKDLLNARKSELKAARRLLKVYKDQDK